MNNDIIEMLQSYVCHTSSDYDRKQDVIKMAKVLVERDNPKKPEVNHYWVFREAWYCPSCKHVIFKKQHFCDHCGQRLDWREVKENG